MPVSLNRMGFEISIRAAILIVMCTASIDGVMAQTINNRPKPAETYESATIDADGCLAIVKTSGESVLVRKEADQTAFSTPLMSSDRTAVAAQAMFGNCCTSYDIPLQLVVYARGKVHRFKGADLPIFKWGFADSGTRIAYGQEPVHFACDTHYELRDIESERLIEAADVPQPCGQNSNPKPVKITNWVAALIQEDNERRSNKALQRP